jgi:TolB protein
MRILSLATLTLILVLTTGCDREAAEQATTSPPIPGSGLLLVSQADSSIFVIDRDGADRVDLVVEDSGLVAIQPTWSPDGRRVVWTEVDHMSEVPEASIVTAGAAGTNVQRTKAPVAPFYYFWDPSGDTIALLGGSAGGNVGLWLLDGGVRLLGEAQPYYFAWAPDGQTLLTHTNLDTVETLTVDGRPTTLERTTARFQAPQWSADGTRLVYATGAPPPVGGVRAGAFQANPQRIVVADADGSIVHRVDTFVGVATFELSPDGTRIAHSDTLDRTTFNFGPLIVTDVESDRPTTVSEDPVLAYQWSPNGESLLYLTTVSGADHPGFRWAVWNGENSRFFQPVTLTTTFANSYLPFWDQYSRSHRLWAPDGSAFAYSALNAEADPTIWVQDLAESAPREVAAGDVVFWSPK